jgi:hypothetical protein
MTLKQTSDAVAVTQGHAGDAIDFALGHCGPDEALAFLDDWRADRANEWPGYVKWLSAQYRHRTAAQPEREAVLEIVADALDCFWNAAIGSAREAQDSTALAISGSLAQGFAAMASRLREPAALTTPAPAECPSCHGLNTSCPDGCGRDPETGELNGTILTPAPAVSTDEIVAMLKDVRADCHLFSRVHGVLADTERDRFAQRAAKITTILAALSAKPEAGESEVERLREALTPSGATKAAYIGEFSFNVIDRDEDGEEVPRRALVPWDQIKEIMAAIRERAALKGTPSDGK